MKLKFWHGVMILIGIIIAIVIYGLIAPGGVPGVPNPKGRSVRVSVHVHRVIFCVPDYVEIEGIDVGNYGCTPSIGDPQGNAIVYAYKDGQQVAMTKKKVDCSCPWGIGWCDARDVIDICLEPGIYKIKVQWEGHWSSERTVVVPG